MLRKEFIDDYGNAHIGRHYFLGVKMAYDNARILCPVDPCSFSDDKCWDPFWSRKGSGNVVLGFNIVFAGGPIKRHSTVSTLLFQFREFEDLCKHNLRSNKEFICIPKSTTNKTGFSSEVTPCPTHSAYSILNGFFGQHRSVYNTSHAYVDTSTSIQSIHFGSIIPISFDAVDCEFVEYSIFESLNKHYGLEFKLFKNRKDLFAWMRENAVFSDQRSSLGKITKLSESIRKFNDDFDFCFNQKIKDHVKEILVYLNEVSNSYYGSDLTKTIKDACKLCPGFKKRLKTFIENFESMHKFRTDNYFGQSEILKLLDEIEAN